MECSNRNFRKTDYRATKNFSAEEVRSICQPQNRNDAGLADIRQFGAPDALFEKLLEQRANKIGFQRFVPTVRKIGFQPTEDLADRLDANRIF